MDWSYIIIPFIGIAVGATGSYFGRDVEIWYSTVKKPRWTPPDWTFGAAWSLIYACAVTSALIVWNATPRNLLFIVTVFAFLVNAVLNALWPYIFFRKHEMREAFFEAMILDATVVLLIVLIVPVSSIAALLLLPYLLWGTFAVFLAHKVWLLNKAS